LTKAFINERKQCEKIPLTCGDGNSASGIPLTFGEKNSAHGIPLRGKGWTPTGGRGRVKKSELPYNENLRAFARNLRKASTLSEVLLWQRLSKKQLLGLDFNRQKIIGNYIVDFFCLEKKLAIEVDGESHNEKIDYDAERDKYLESLGIKVLRIHDLEVKINLDGVVWHIEKFINELC